jgi:pyruvate/2-oxoglutarate/acetoin dehydrogenase E1 component
MAEFTYRDALKEGIRAALHRDALSFLMGEDIGRYGGCYAVTKGLFDEFGPERIIDTPLCESGFVGAGIGAALGGMHPIVEIMTVNFSLLALDQIINNAATLRHMSGGQLSVPLVIRMAYGAGKQLAAQHSHSFEGIYAHIPGIKVLTPATIDDAYHMIAQALADPDPVIIFEHVMLLGTTAELTAQAPKLAMEQAAIRRLGQDISLFTWGGCLPKTLAAAEQLAQRGIEAEVVDLRCLRPLDKPTLLASLAKTHRAILIEEGWKTCGMGAEIAAFLSDEGFWHLDAPIGRIATIEVPIPYPAHLEQAALPNIEQIVSAAQQLVGRS